MNISMNSAINAYNNAANIAKNLQDPNVGKEAASNGGNNIFSSLVASPVENLIGNLRKAETVSLANLTQQVDLTDVVNAVSQAESTLKTVVAVRDRLVSALQELEKMPI